MNRNDAVVDDDMLLQLFSTGGDTQTKIPHHFPEISHCVQVLSALCSACIFLTQLVTQDVTANLCVCGVEPQKGSQIQLARYLRMTCVQIKGMRVD